jgi:hypothetical protein
MRFWSKGLGKRCLAMDCGKEAVAIDGSAMRLSGRVKPPLGWAYTITMDESDWLDFVELTLHPTMVRYLLRRRRLGLALRAAWHLSLFYLAVAAHLPRVWSRRASVVPAGK